MPARSVFVDNTLTDQSSIVAFIAQNWKLGLIGGGSTDAVAGTLDNMFNFNRREPSARRVILNPSSGEVVSDRR
jgi:phospholipase C